MTRICPARERKKRSLAELAGRSRVVGPAARWLADAVGPPVCPVSGEAVDISGRLAPESWQGLTFLDDPVCRQCGLPFPYPGGTGSQSGALCGPCIADPPRFDMARAPLLYDDASRPLVLGFKHGGRRDMIAQFARWMAMAGRDCLDGADMIMPVPLHWRRLLARRYNQSALLGAALADISGLPFDTDTLLRRKPTPSQAGKAVKARRRNMAGAFHVAGREAVAGRSVVLVDDVYTTGATVAACAGVLRRAGVREIRIVTLCRVVRTRDATI